MTIGALLALLIGVMCVWQSGGEAVAKSASEGLMVRIAELEIDPAQIDTYKAILAKEQEASVRLELGVVMLHSVQFTENPTQIRLIEVYANRDAYEAHIKSPHFLEYKTSTEKMVRSLKLIPTTPILLCAKSQGLAGGPITCM